MELVWIVPVAGLGAVLVALWFAVDILGRDAGTPKMQEVGAAIYTGAMAFLRRQYSTIAQLAVVTAVIIGVIVGSFDDSVKIGVYTGIAFIIGAMCSGVAGFIGMYVAVRSNSRCASAATHSLRDALTVALRGGAVSGLLVVALSLLGVATIFAVYSRLLDNPIDEAPFLIVGFAFGASFVALFAQLGGGIYTKAADVGADLVGKVEAGIPEDDPRNAGVIADLVGDNVGDCAGRGADLFESSAAENIGAMILGVALFAYAQEQGLGSPEAWIFLPMTVIAFGLIASIVGILSVPFFTHEGQDPLTPLNYGYYVVMGLSVVFLLIVTAVLLPSDSWHWFFLAGLVGIATSVVFVYVSQYYTAKSYRPVKEIANASLTGPGTNIIMGTAVGFEATASTAIAIGTALVVSFILGDRSGVGEGFAGGIFGTAVATMGMLMSAGYILAMDTFGPITDNANGIIEMAGAPDEARDITDAMDAVGNTTKALTKGYALASAGLAAFLLFSAFLDKVEKETGEAVIVRMNDVGEFVAGLIGVMLVFLFSSLAIRAVGTAAGAIIEEVRRQFREHPGIMKGEEMPDYNRAVDITTRAALKGMVAPGILAVGTPIAVGVIFRLLYEAELLGDTGPEAVAALLMVGTIGGIILATFLNNVGGAWDNAKKYIEAGMLKVPAAGGGWEVLGKGSDAHKAAVVGDTVGDPFKDTAGPSLHVLVKLLSTVTLVLAPLFISK
ncbi:MAG TPA: sodium-translocating pyrophosphatase [Dehalococcoidia bacterium]|jgi:K(+)-stimulated pyrophosphate-energized sodium pump|nr:sodium-translocating pyrophosphatase [Dehalococcoidia bacterium]